MPPASATVHILRDPEQAALLLHPLRIRILEEAREPASAAEIARRIDETPQKVNYHVGTLADAGLLRAAGERRRRNFVERRYRATARHYLLSQEVLGALGLPSGAPVSEDDALSAARLLGLTALIQDELGRTLDQARAAGAGRVPTLSIDAEVRFASAAERARFADELRKSVLNVAARYGGSGRGWPFRMVLGCYPLPDGGPTGGSPGDETSEDDAPEEEEES